MRRKITKFRFFFINFWFISIIAKNYRLKQLSALQVKNFDKNMFLLKILTVILSIKGLFVNLLNIGFITHVLLNSIYNNGRVMSYGRLWFSVLASHLQISQQRLNVKSTNLFAPLNLDYINLNNEDN